ncbi:MmgE/PrpD family protein [Thermodesulfobacteriota bacterium]
MGITNQLIQNCSDIVYHKLPVEVIDRTKYLLLDYLGVATRGMLSESGQAAQRMVARQENNMGRAVVIGTDISVGPSDAALINGIAAHSIEMDDVVNAASLHPAVTIMSTALAAGHISGCNGKQMIEAIVAGYEVVVRLGMALDPAAHYEQGFHPTATCGTLGSAITAAKLLKLTDSEMTNALGIAGSQAAGSMEYLSDGSFTKRFHGGWAAHSGLIAALLAKEAFTGPGTIIEGKFGFLNSYSPRPKPELVLKDWGNPFQVLATSIKPYACCRYKQGPIDGIIQIMQENQLTPDDVDSVILAVLKAGFALVVQPEELKQNPRSIVDAQFSMPFGAAVAILYGKATLEEYTLDKIRSPEVKNMMRRIRCVEDDEIEKDFPKKWPARATIKTTDGKKFETKIDYPKGDPENSLSWDELIQKFKGLVQPVFSKEQIDRIIDRVLSLEKIDRFDEFSAVLIKK